jgi:hypothetical protein
MDGIAFDAIEEGIKLGTTLGTDDGEGLVALEGIVVGVKLGTDVVDFLLSLLLLQGQLDEYIFFKESQVLGLL